MSLENPVILRTEQEQGSQPDHYYSGFNAEWLNNPEVLEKAKKFAEFYREKFDQIKLEVADSEEALIHFTADQGFVGIQNAEQPALENKSRFYDGGREKLEKLGINLDELDKNFGDNNCVVSIPLREFDKWTSSLSWLKLAAADVLNNVFVFKVPQKDIILRDGKFVDEMFKLNIEGAEGSQVDDCKINYIKSTHSFDDKLFTEQSLMEAWVPRQISLKGAQTMHYSEENK